MTPHRRTLEISSCIQCPFCMIDTSTVTTHQKEFCNFTVPYWSTELLSHDDIPDWCLLPHSSAPSEQKIREKVLEELFIWVDSEQTITITTDKLIEKIFSLRSKQGEQK